jgi:hypothetical protein
MIQLDVNNPSEVSSPTSIEVDVAGQSSQKMIVLSGIACPEWEVTDDGHLYDQSVVVNLRRTVLAVVQATVSVGLASIGNKNTTFQFACDSSALVADPVTQELTLNADLALRGDWSILNRFGYQIVAIVTTQSTGISGVIRWSRGLFDPSTLPAGELGSLFLITANVVTGYPGPPGGFGGSTLTPVASGSVAGITSDANDYIAAYNIPGGPYNQPLVIRADPSALFKTPWPPYSQQGAGPNPVVLTVVQPSASGVDFRVEVNVIK